MQALQTSLTWNRRHLLATTRAVLNALTSDRLTASLRVQSHNGWDDGRLKRLQFYLSDSAPLVAAAAQFTLPPIETQISNKGK